MSSNTRHTKLVRKKKQGAHKANLRADLKRMAKIREIFSKR